MKLVKLTNYQLTGWLNREKNFDGKVLSKALEVFAETSPNEAGSTLACIIKQSWNQMRTRLFSYNANKTVARAVMTGDLLMKLTPIVLREGSP